MPRLDVVNREPGDRTIRPLVKALNLVLGPLSRRDWDGGERLPASGGVIVVANHISNADPLALGQFLAYSGRWPRFLAKSSLFGVPGLGRLLRGAGQIPVERASSHAGDALTAAWAALEAGQAVVVYPEGTITYDPDLWPMRGRTGAARLALATAARSCRSGSGVPRSSCTVGPSGCPASGPGRRCGCWWVHRCRSTTCAAVRWTPSCCARRPSGSWRR